MKRVLQYKLTDNGYGCFENSEMIFEIQKDNLQFNVKNFYGAFYGEDKDLDDIVLENKVEDDKNANRVFDCISQLVEKCKEKMAELPELTKEQNTSEGE